MFDFDELTLADVSRNFGRRRALSRVSFTCQAGEVIGLLGPNGSGKSTLLSILSTLLTVSSGDIRYGARTARQAGPGLRARIGLLGHDLHLYPELTARENLEFFGQLYRIPDSAACAAQALETARLSDRSDEPVSSFSRGMRQRLALERALLHGPRLVLLDEPFTGLDDMSANHLVERLSRLRHEGRLLLIATHDLETAQRLLDRAVVLRDGRVAAITRPGAILKDAVAGAAVHRA